jgi:subtilisin family serine protease
VIPPGRIVHLATAAGIALGAALYALPAAATHPDGAAIVRVLGAHAAATLAPMSGTLAALVALPPGTSAESLGLSPVAPGIGRLRGDGKAIGDFRVAHPTLRMEVPSTLHTLAMGPGQWVRAADATVVYGATGKGALVGVADTGIDILHPDLRDSTGHTRVAWLLDMSQAPRGKYPDLESRFGVTDGNGKVVNGAVFDASDIDALIAKPLSSAIPRDEVGHGTHVTSIAVGLGVQTSTGFRGIAPEAGIIFARVTRTGTDTIENDDLLRGTDFMYDRADAMGRPIAVNLSVGTDFGSHDGRMVWEQALAGHIGPSQPGHAMVVAAGNSGHIGEFPVHAEAYVGGGRTRVGVVTKGATSGSLQVWVATRAGSDLHIGLDGPDGQWVPPTGAGQQAGKSDPKGQWDAGVVYGSTVPDSPIPDGSDGAVVLWSGAWPAGTYYVTLEGRGSADLWMQATGDADQPSVGFDGPVRESTINLPGAHPSILAVGCSIDRPSWLSQLQTKVQLAAPLLDEAGGISEDGSRHVDDGETCWFSSAGPNAEGVPKPEIIAPGGGVVAAMSRNALPGGQLSIFTNGSCPINNGKQDTKCLQVDDQHAVAVGTSMSAPHVTGAVALLFERDPTLTQERIVALLQAGAHGFRGAADYADQNGPGELDVLGALRAQEASTNPALALPVREASWITTSRDYLPADGSSPVTVFVELRTADGEHPADMFAGDRLAADAAFDGKPVSPPPQLVRVAPGLWTFQLTGLPGTGGQRASVGATFDGQPIVAAYRTLPIATDAWNARYPARFVGACASSSSAAVAAHVGPPSAKAPLGFAVGSLGLVALRRRRRRR